MIALVVLLAHPLAEGATVQLRLVVSTPTGAMDGRLNDVASALKSRGLGGGKLVGERTVGIAERQRTTVNLPEDTRVEISNEGERSDRVTLRIQCRGWGGAVTLKDHPRNKPALIVGPERGGGRLVLAVKLR